MADPRCPKCGRKGTYLAKWDTCTACTDEALLRSTVSTGQVVRGGKRHAVIPPLAATGKGRPVRERMSERKAPRKAPAPPSAPARRSRPRG